MKPSPATLAALAGAQLAFAPPLSSEPIQLQPPQSLYAGATAMDLGDYAIPCVADWNGDGRKDLLVGYRYEDKVALFLNTGTDAQPVFGSSTRIQAGGVDIQIAGAGCGAPAPWVCDYNADGRKDLLVGAGADGRIFFYRNTNSDAQPILAPGVPLMVGAAPLSVSARATPFVHDWDEDGLKDLLCGAGDGSIYFFRNTNSAQAPAYAVSVPVRAGGALLNLGIRSVARVFDWDGDGLKDLVGSSSTGVYWCRNAGSNAAPVLQAAVPLRAPRVGSGLAPIYTGARMRLDLADWNNDGTIDLLLGNADGTVFLYEGYHFAFACVTPQAGHRCAVRWNSASLLNYDLLGGAVPDNIQTVLATNLPSAGKVTAWTNAPGSAQGYYRVRISP